MLKFLTNRQWPRDRRPTEPGAHARPLSDTAPGVRSLALSGHGAASDYARALLRDIGIQVEAIGASVDRDLAGESQLTVDLDLADESQLTVEPHHAHDWAASGAMSLSGLADGAPELAPGPLASAARGALRALAVLAPDDRAVAALAAIDAPALLGARAAIAGLRRCGRISVGGACRLIETRDGFVALQLARPEDTALIPAWLETGPVNDAWATVTARVAQRRSYELVERGRWMGLPVAPVWPPLADVPPWLWLRAGGARRRAPAPVAPRVVDLSSLWAGPLCAMLLARSGADVVKVESAERPDAARFGPAAFFDSLNTGKRSVVVRLATKQGRDALRALIDSADIVVESARPRALEQLGILARDHLARRPGLTWVSITAYGRATPGGDWVGFGDDAAAAAGLAAATGSHETRPLFCGDAISDPLTGLHAAAAAMASQRLGGGHLLDLSLCGVASRALHFSVDAEPARVYRSRGRFVVEADGVRVPVASPRLGFGVSGSPVARAFGADTSEVLREVGAC